MNQTGLCVLPVLLPLGGLRPGGEAHLKSFCRRFQFFFIPSSSFVLSVMPTAGALDKSLRETVFGCFAPNELSTSTVE